MKRLQMWWAVVLLLYCCAFGVRWWTQPKVVVVPHHNLVASKRWQLLSFVASRRIQTSKIILLSPDHFSNNQHMLLKGTSGFKQVKTLFLEPLIVKSDHGIQNVYSDLHQIWPNSTIETIIIGQKVTRDQLEPVLKALKTECDIHCMLVVSVDFSHYLPVDLALVHDETTIGGLRQRDADKLLTSEVDSPQSLWLASSLATADGAKSWHLYDHTNSGLMLQNYHIETTSHVFGWYQRGAQPQYNLPHTFVALPTPTTYSLDSLGDRLFYGADSGAIKLINGNVDRIDCNGPTFSLTQLSTTIFSGWTEDDQLTLGSTPIQLVGNKYKWNKQRTPIEIAAECRNRIHLLPGTLVSD